MSFTKPNSNKPCHVKHITIRKMVICERANGPVVSAAAASLPVRARTRGAHQTPAPEWGWRETL
jgi:hypothetical protein